MRSAADWQRSVEAVVAQALEVRSADRGTWSRVGGSALNTTWSLAIAGRRAFVKTNAADRSDMLDAEADGLRALATAGAIRVPAPIAQGAVGAVAYLALEWLEFAGRGRDAALGRALAALHRNTGTRFGWHRDNTIGTTAQANAWSDDWPSFFRDRRLAPQFARAAANGHRGAFARSGERLLLVVPALLAGHSPVRSLLHGDLWSGNAAQLESGEPVIFDPAVYFGDREADLAMSELFGGFDADFHAAYRDAWPLTAGYATRRTLYNLYHVLNHLNLFGAGYGMQAESMVGALLAECG